VLVVRTLRRAGAALLALAHAVVLIGCQKAEVALPLRLADGTLVGTKYGFQQGFDHFEDYDGSPFIPTLDDRGIDLALARFRQIGQMAGLLW